MEVDLKYAPHTKQILFHQSQCDETLYGGAAGGGKSHASVIDALCFCLQHRNVHAYLFRRTYPELEDSLIRKALEVIPAGLGRYIAGRHDWEFPNGSAMHFRHCKNESDLTKYQGAEIHRLYIDELTHWPLGMVTYLRTRLRAAAELGIQPVAKYTTNPGGIGHSWVKKRFVDPAQPGTVIRTRERSEALGGKEMESTRLYVQCLPNENPHLTDAYIFELERKPAALRDALLYGKWDAFEGQVFAEWVDNPDGYDSHQGTHVIHPFRIPPSWPRYRVMDWGYARPYAVLWAAVDPDDVIYLYRELYGCKPDAPNAGVQEPASTVADHILNLERELEPGLHFRGIADPHIFDTQTGDSVGDIMARAGVYFDKANNNRLLGKMQVHDRLRFDAYGYPKLYVFDRCTETIRTLPELPYSTKRPEDVDTEAEDHIYDALRYLLMERPLGQRIKPRPAPKPYNPLE